MKTDLTQGKPIEHLLTLTLPSIWGALAVMSMSLVDTWIIARLGADALAAVSFTFPIVMVITSIAFGIGTASISLITQAVGRQQAELAATYATHALVIALGIGLVFACVGLATITPLFRLLQAPEHLLPLIHNYLSIWYLGSIFIVVTLTANALIRASGNTRFPSFVLISIAIVNLALTPLLVHGLLGFPKLALHGAALATSGAFLVGLLVVLYYLKVHLKWLKPSLIAHNIVQYWKDILVIAGPNAASSMITPVTVAITVSFIAHYGSAAVAGYGVASRISALGLIFFAALSTTLTLFTGQHWGARRMERVDRALRLSVYFAIAWGLFLATLFWLFATPIVSLFTTDPLAIESASNYLYIIPISFAFLSIVMISSAISNGIGEPLPALFFTITRLLLLYLPLVWLLSAWLGLNGIYIATALSNFCVGVFAFFWIREKARKGKAARIRAGNRQ